MWTQEKQSFLAATNDKLVHPLSEVRRRAVQSLDFKLKHRLLSLEDVAKDRTVLKSLLGCLQYSDNGGPTDVAVLMLLGQAAASSPVAARQLLHLGAEQLLGQLQQQGRDGEVQAAAGYAFSVILAVPKHTGAGACYPATPALAPSAADTTPRYGPAYAGRWGHQPAPAPAVLPTPSTVGAAPPGRGSPGRASLLPTHGPAPAFTYSPQPAVRLPRSMDTPAGSVLGGAWSDARDGAAGWPGTSRAAAAAAGSAMRPPLKGPGRQGRHDLGEDLQPHLTAVAADTAAAASTAPRDWLLQPVQLGQADDQELFELSLRLKCAADPRVILPALIQLHGCFLVDLPAEAIVMRHGIVGHLTALITTAGSSPELVAVAASCLLRLVAQVKRAMLLATEPMYTSCGAAGGGAAAAAAGGPGDSGAHGEESAARRSAWASPSRSPECSAGRTDVPSMNLLGGAGQEQEQRRAPHAQALLPQPMPAGAGAAAPGDDPPVNVTLRAYDIALQVFHALRDPHRLFALAPLAEELLPLLLVGRDGTLPGAGEVDRARWTQLLQALSRALVANLSMARADSPPIVQAFARDGTVGPLPPVLNAPAAAVLALSIQLLAALPRELWEAKGVVPAALTDAAAAVARDEVLAALLPGARRALLPLLAVLRPDVGALLEVAAAGEVAAAAGEAALRQLPALRAGELPPGAWLAQLRRALPALHLPGQDGLLEGLVQGLALVCGAGDEGGGGGQGGARRGEADEGAWVQQDEAEEVFLSLLSHASPAVAMACYSLLEGLLSEARARPGHPLLRLLSRKAVLERLVVLGLSDERTRRQVARILLGALPDAAVQSCVQPWSFWIRLYEADPQVGALAASMEAGERGREGAPLESEGCNYPECGGSGGGDAPPDWGRLQAPLLELYSSDAERRQAAARRLAERLQEAGGVAIALDEPHVADPFRVCLDNGARDDLVVPAANPRLARSFRPADVSNLLAILANGGLALELRRSAAEQMLALTAEERLRAVLEEPGSLHTIACVASLRDPTTDAPLGASQLGALAAAGLPPPAPDLLSTLDVQLPLAAINLLFVLAARSPRVRAWLLAPQRGAGQAPASGAGTPPAAATAGNGAVAGAAGGDGGGGGGLEMLAGGMLPLVFHSMVTVRRGVARLLAALCFGAEADRWPGWEALAKGVAAAAAATTAPPASSQGGAGGAGGGVGTGRGTGSSGDVLLLPYPFQRRYSFPCRITWVRLPPACQSSGAEPVALEGKPRLQDLVAEQRHLVVLLIQERQALQAAGGDLRRLLTLMNERPDCLGGLPPAALHTLAASIRAVAPAGLVSRGLAAVRAATSHPECTAALRELQVAASTRQGAAALAAADWQVHFDGLLSNAPISAEDRALWGELLELLRRALASGAVSQLQLLHLAEYLSRSALEVLSAPDAAVEPPLLPVALAGSAAPVVSAPDLAMFPHTHAQLQCTVTVLATLVDLVRCARTRLPLQQALQVLAALSPARLLRTVAVAFLDNPAASYGCRAAALQLLLEVTALLAAQLHATPAGLAGPGAAAAIPEVLDAAACEALLACLKALLGNLGSFSAGGGGAPRFASGGGGGGGGLRTSFGVAIGGRGGWPEDAAGAGGFSGKGAARMALRCLLHLTALLPARDWAPAWRELSGSFWVSRLLRDRDAVLRALAAEVLCRLLQPGAEASQAMVAQGWPDAVKMMAKAAVDPASCYAVRTAALRVLCCCMAQEVGAGSGSDAGHVTQVQHRSGDQQSPGQQQQQRFEEEDQAEAQDLQWHRQQPPGEPSCLPRRQLFTSLTSLPPSAVLLQQQEPLWAALPRMLRDPDAPAPFTAAAVALLLQTALLDGERVAGLLQQPGLLDRLLQLLEPRPLPAAATAAAPATPGSGPGHTGAAASALSAEDGVLGTERAALLMAVLGAEAMAVCATAPRGAGGHGGMGPAGRGEGDASPSGGGGFADGGDAAAAAAWEGFETDTQLEVRAGLEATGFRSRQEWAAATAGGAMSPASDPTHHRHLLHTLGCGALVAQLLANGLQDPPMLQLPPALARSAAESTAAAALAAFARLAVGVAAWDAARGGAPAAQLVEGAARLEAVRQAAAAANAALQLLDEGGLRNAVVTLDASLCRSSGPLLTRCAELLLSGCAPRSLRLAVVCLLATLLSRQDTAAALLRFEGTDNEHLVGSTGREVGAGLCAALIDLLPDDALLPATGGSGSAAPATVHASALHHVRASVATEAGAPHRPQQPTVSGDLRADSLCIIVSLRNLLAYSGAAKSAALRSGYHRVLMQGCARMAAARAAAQAAGPGGRAAGGDRHHPSASALSSATGLGTPRRGSAATAASTAAAAARPGARRGASAAGRDQRRAAPPGKAKTGAAQEPDGAAPADADAASDFAEQPPPPPLLRSAASPSIRGATEPAGGRRQDAESGRAAARLATEHKLVASLSLLRHLAFGSAPARKALVHDGAVAVLRTMWPATTTATAAATAGPLFHELLGCLTNLLPECPQARARVAQEAGAAPAAAVAAAAGVPAASGAIGAVGVDGGAGASSPAGGPGTLLGHLLTLIFSVPRLESSTFGLAVGALRQLAAAEDGAALLVKSPFLGLCQKALQELAGGTAVRAGGRDTSRQVALLEVVTSLACWPEGQRALLRSSSGPGLLELALRLISPGTEGGGPMAAVPAHGVAAASSPQGGPRPSQPQQPLELLRNAALALVRNLCFSPDAKAHLMAHPALLPSLVAAAEGVADNPRGAAYAASAMWALAYHGEKVKAAIRRVPSAHQRLVAAYSSCRFAEDSQHKLDAHFTVDKGSYGDATGGTRGAAESTPRKCRENIIDLENVRWVRLASSQLCGLLAALQALNASVSRGKAQPSDWSPQRDQFEWTS